MTSIIRVLIIAMAAVIRVPFLVHVILSSRMTTPYKVLSPLTPAVLHPWDFNETMIIAFYNENNKAYLSNWRVARKFCIKWL